MTKIPRANCTNNNYCSLMVKQKLSYFVMKKDKIRNEHVRGSVKVPPVRRPYGHRIMLDVPVPGKRRIGRLTTKWKDSCKRDIESVGLVKRGARPSTTSDGNVQGSILPHRDSNLLLCVTCRNEKRAYSTHKHIHIRRATIFTHYV